MKRTFAGLILFALAASSASAGVIVDTFGPSNSYESSGYYIPSFIPGPILITGAIAMPFTPSVNSVLTLVELAVTPQPSDTLAGVGSDFTAQITSDDPGNGPGGTVYETWTANATGFVSLTPIVTINLVGGTKYWLVVSPGPSPGGVQWNWTPGEPSNDIAFDEPNGGGPNNGWFESPDSTSAYRISADPTGGVPEPSTLFLGFPALALVAVVRRRARKTV